MSDSLWPHGLQHARLPCPPLTPRAYSNSCPSCQWCHPTISSSAIPFSSHFQSFPAAGSFPVSWFFTSGSQSIRVSASASVLPMNIQNWWTFFYRLLLLFEFYRHPAGLIKGNLKNLKKIMAFNTFQFSSVCRLVVSNSLWFHGLQHARLSYPSPSLEFAQTHVHRVSDATQPSNPLLSPSPPTYNLSQHQGLFPWVHSLH